MVAARRPGGYAWVSPHFARPVGPMSDTKTFTVPTVLSAPALHRPRPRSRWRSEAFTSLADVEARLDDLEAQGRRCRLVVRGAAAFVVKWR